MADEPKEKKPEAESANAEAGSAPSKSGVALTEGKCGIIGVKAGMTQIFTSEGDIKGVTVIDLTPNYVTQFKSLEKDGYRAVQVGVLPRKPKRAKKTELGHVKNQPSDIAKNGFYHYEEIRLPTPKNQKDPGFGELTVGCVLSADFVKPGDWVDLSSVSKGKGFQGTMKRYHYGGGPKSHGASVVHRSGGSIGQCADPGKVVKGRKMAVQNVRVVSVDLESRTMLVNGSIPGPTSGIVKIQKAAKKQSVQA
jgi:large subunit ribosomal protein L3